MLDENHNRPGAIADYHFDDRTENEKAIDKGEREPSVSAAQLIENLYPSIREEKDPTALRAMVEAWESIDVEKELGPDWKQGIKEIVADIALTELTMSPHNDFDFVMEKMARMASFDGRNLVAAIGAMAHAGDDRVFNFLEANYNKFTQEQRQAILGNIMFDRSKPIKRKFLIDHIDDLGAKGQSQRLLTMMRLQDEHTEVQAAAERTMVQ